MAWNELNTNAVPARTMLAQTRTRCRLLDISCSFTTASTKKLLVLRERHRIRLAVAVRRSETYHGLRIWKFYSLLLSCRMDTYVRPNHASRSKTVQRRKAN